MVPTLPRRPSCTEVAEVAHPPAQVATAVYCSRVREKEAIASAGSMVRKVARPKPVPSALVAINPVGVSVR